MEFDGPGNVVISGHGEFNLKYLQYAKRTPVPTFVVPAGVTIRVYAPPGAALENDVANLIEQGRYPTADTLELKHKDTVKTLPLSDDYPMDFPPGSEMINYTVAPPGNLTIKGSPLTVDEKKSLKSIVDGLEGQDVILHYACCSSSYVLKTEYRELLPNYGWYVRLK